MPLNKQTKKLSTELGSTGQILQLNHHYREHVSASPLTGDSQ